MKALDSVWSLPQLGLSNWSNDQNCNRAKKLLIDNSKNYPRKIIQSDCSINELCTYPQWQNWLIRTRWSRLSGSYTEQYQPKKGKADNNLPFGSVDIH
ncbi:MAG: hypothetical protein EA409_04650 [Saprospirales bacterium]|nr:MAG: hypothetical protein EA409_04650 [Saprospirales bacterium]